MPRAEITAKEKEYKIALENLKAFVKEHFPDDTSRHAQIDLLIAESKESGPNFVHRSNELMSEFEKSKPPSALYRFASTIGKPTSNRRKTPYEIAFPLQFKAIRYLQNRIFNGLTRDEYNMKTIHEFHTPIANDAARCGIALPMDYLQYFPETGTLTDLQDANQHKILHEMIVEHHINKTWTNTKKGQFIRELTHERYACGAFFVFYTPTEADLQLKSTNDAAVNVFIAKTNKSAYEVLDWFTFKTDEEKELLRSVNKAISDFVSTWTWSASENCYRFNGTNLGVDLADSVIIWLLNRMGRDTKSDLRRVCNSSADRKPNTATPFKFAAFTAFAEKMVEDHWTRLHLTIDEVTRFVEVINPATKTRILKYVNYNTSIN